MTHISIMHVACRAKDIASSQPGGRFFFLPGSSARARLIAERFDNRKTFASERGHDVDIGSISFGSRKVDVGCVSTGMGCPSLGIIVNELIFLGAKRFLRIGTAGSLAPKRVRAGDSVICTAAVRDEGASLAYAPPMVPAVASVPLINALIRSASSLHLKHQVHVGLVHTKDSLHGREFGVGPMKRENRRFMNVLSDLGVLATEMEASHLFSLAQVHSGTKSSAIRGGTPFWNGIHAGCVLAVIGDITPFARPEIQREAIKQVVELAIKSAEFFDVA